MPVDFFHTHAAELKAFFVGPQSPGSQEMTSICRLLPATLAGCSRKASELFIGFLLSLIVFENATHFA